MDVSRRPSPVLPASPRSRLRQIASVATHPDYDSATLANDLAVVTLSGTPSVSEFRRLGVHPIIINKQREQPRTNQVVTLTGWGAPSGKSGEQQVAAELAITNMRVSSFKRCTRYLEQKGVDLIGLDDDIMICASLRDRTSSCLGDSGGTLWRGVARRRRAAGTASGVDGEMGGQVEHASSSRLCLSVLVSQRMSFRQYVAFVGWCGGLRSVVALFLAAGPIFRQVKRGKSRSEWLLYGVLSFGHSEVSDDMCPVEYPEWYVPRVCLSLHTIVSWRSTRLPPR